ncbi:MAG TPA: hypothetical protein VKB35_17160 [Ktedonobacteraceae bacterium]|nr:hypothetical protein [Ktedonobacteraceae bacterium]
MKRLTSTLHGLGRATVAGAFWLSTRLLFRVEVHRLGYDPKAPRTYYGMCHKRDLDPIVLVPTIVFPRGWRGVAGDVHFALRGDAFSPGYLARITMRPRWFARLIRGLAVGPALRWLGARPIRDLYRPAEEWIRDLLDLGYDKRVGDILVPAFIEELATATGAAGIATYRLSRLLAWRYQDVLQRVYGPEIILGPARRVLERRIVGQIKGDLATLDRWLWDGGSLYSSPEGQLSPDGKLSPVNVAMHRLMEAAPPDTSIIPIFIIYDFMTLQKLHIFVDFAPPIEYAPRLSSKELDAQLRMRWMQNARFTCTQLASGFLIHASRAGLPSFTLEDLADDLYHQALRLAEAGRHVDQRLLKPAVVRKRAADFLKYAARHGLVHRSGKHTWVPTVTETVLQVRLKEVGYDQAPLMYAWNELQEMLEDP